MCFGSPRTYHGYAILAVVLVYTLMRFLVFKISLTSFHYWALGSSVVTHWICYKTILGHIEFGGQIYDKDVGMVELSVDTLYILMFTQICGILSDSAWYLMCLIPLIVVYKYGGGVLGYFFGGSKVEDDGEIYLSKTQAKKQKRAEKFSGGR